MEDNHGDNAVRAILKREFQKTDVVAIVSPRVVDIELAMIIAKLDAFKERDGFVPGVLHNDNRRAATAAAAVQ